LLIDCEKGAPSASWFEKLAAHLKFDRLVMPLDSHGRTLDKIFRQTRDENLLLIDSDLEIIDGRYLKQILRWMEHPHVFGAGYTHGPEWMNDGQWFPHKNMGLYKERMYIPLTCLKSALIREGLDAGYSFGDRYANNEIGFSKRLSDLLARRYRSSYAMHWRFDFLRLMRKPYLQYKPHYTYADTGADLYNFLKYERNLMFAGPSFRLGNMDSIHYGGVTRQFLNSIIPTDVPIRQLSDAIRERIRVGYGSEFLPP